MGLQAEICISANNERPVVKFVLENESGLCRWLVKPLAKQAFNEIMLPSSEEEFRALMTTPCYLRSKPKVL